MSLSKSENDFLVVTKFFNLCFDVTTKNVVMKNTTENV
jgi:hypothetical protein